MELHELQKMISIIHDKKPRCRGNLRVKVLLKSTHDYVRRSLLDDQLGNSESLMTLLRNSGTEREPMANINSVHETDSQSMNSDEILHSDLDLMDCEEAPVVVEKKQELQNSGCSSQSVKYVSGNIPTTSEALSKMEGNSNQTLASIPTQPVSHSPNCSKAFKNSNKTLDKSGYLKGKYSKLTKALQKIMKQWELIMSKAKSDASCFEYQYQSITRMRKLLLESKICFKADFENLSFSQQRINLMYIRVIKKMLKQCDRILGCK